MKEFTADGKGRGAGKGTVGGKIESYQLRAELSREKIWKWVKAVIECSLKSWGALS